MEDYTANKLNYGKEYHFSGILEPLKGVCDSTRQGDTTCNWSKPTSTDQTVLWGDLDPGCVYDPSDPDNGNIWVYGCNLDVGDEIFNNEDGWQFTVKTVNEGETSTGLVQGVGSEQPGAVSLTMRRTVFPFNTSAIHEIDLSNATVTVERMLDELGGDDELVRHHITEEDLFPLVLMPPERWRWRQK